MGILVLADPGPVFRVLAERSWRVGNAMYYMVEGPCTYMAEQAEGGVVFRADAHDPHLHASCVDRLRSIVTSIIDEVPGAQTTEKLDLTV